MMYYVLASGSPLWEQILATAGQIAAIILVIELLIFAIIALALNAALTFAFAWLREEANLIKKLRPWVDSVNTTTAAAMKGTLSPAQTNQNKIVRTVAEIPAQANAVEKKIEQGTDRIAGAIIEFRARTVMVQGIVKAFFLPGLTSKRRLPDVKSPGLKMLLEERSSEIQTSTEPGDGYVGALVASEDRLEPVSPTSTKTT